MTDTSSKVSDIARYKGHFVIGDKMSRRKNQEDEVGTTLQ